MKQIYKSIIENMIMSMGLFVYLTVIAIFFSAPFGGAFVPAVISLMPLYVLAVNIYNYIWLKNKEKRGEAKDGGWKVILDNGKWMIME